jgi:hypothetical protein
VVLSIATALSTMVEFAVQTHVLEQTAHIAVVALLEEATAVVDHSEEITAVAQVEALLEAALVVAQVEALLEAALAVAQEEVHSAVALPVV